MKLVIFWYFFQLWSWLLHIPTVADLKGWRSSTLAAPWNTLLYFAIAIYSSKMCSTVIPLFSAPWTHSNAHKRVVSELMFGNDFFFFEKERKCSSCVEFCAGEKRWATRIWRFLLWNCSLLCLETSIIAWRPVLSIGDQYYYETVHRSAFDVFMSLGRWW